MRTFAAFALASPRTQGAIAAAPALDRARMTDLSAGPGKPDTQPLQLALHAHGRGNGSFCGSTFETGRWMDNRGRVCASVRTPDGVGPAHSAVCLDGATARDPTRAGYRSVLFNRNAARPQP